MKRIGLMVKSSSAEAVGFGCEVAAWVKGRGTEVFITPDLADRIPAATALSLDDLPDAIEAMIVLGGDGTMLAAARLINGRKVPIVGVNLGGLGFLTAIAMKEAYPLLERVLNDDYAVEERMMLAVEVEAHGKINSRHKVLNDVVIKATSARLSRLETRINKEYIATYRADGLIIATPTGSTAYSLSAAGPILYPTIHSIIVNPICPFNLTNRPVVIPDWMTVDVTIMQGNSEVQLVLDGQVDLPLSIGDRIMVRRAGESVYLIKNEGKGYFDILRERFLWEPGKSGR